MDEKLKRRMAGAGVLLIPAFVLVSLLPTPSEVAMPEGVEVVTIPLYEAPIVTEAPPSAVAVPPSLVAPSVADGDGTATQDVEGSGDEDASAEMPIDTPQETPIDAVAEAAPADRALAPTAAAPEPAPEPAPGNRPAVAAKPVAPAPARPAAAVPARPAPTAPEVAQPEAKKPAVMAPEVIKPPPMAAPAAEPARSASSGKVYVQVGGFASIANARQAQERLKALGQASLLSPVETAQGTLYRVRIGPFASREAAQPVLARAAANGFAGATMVAP